MLLTILRGTLLEDMSSHDSLAAGLSEHQDSLAAGLSEHGDSTTMDTSDQAESSDQDKLDKQDTSSDSAKYLLVQSEEDRLKYNPLDAGVLVEGSKVIGQNSIRVAGQVSN